MQSQREFWLSKNRQVKSIFCQVCVIAIQRQVCICSNCLSLLCGSCSQKHVCLQGQCKDNDKRINKGLKNQLDQTEKQSCQYATSEFQSCSRSQTVNQKIVPTNCQRCRMKSAVKKCLNCSIRHYCLNCFKLLHSSQKMMKHESIDLSSVEKQEKKFIVTNIVSQYQGKRGGNSKLAELNLNEIALSSQIEQGELKQQNKLFTRSIYEGLTKNSTFLASLKVSIEQQSISLKKRSSQMMNIVRKELQQIIQETKLKLMQMDLKFEEKTKASLKEFHQLMSDIRKTEIIFGQLVMMIQNRPVVNTLWRDKITKKLNKQVDQMLKLSQKHSEIQQKNQIQSFSDYLQDQSSAIKEKITRIDFKKLIYTQSPTKSNITVTIKSPKKSEKSLNQGKKKSQFNSCKNSNISSCKSIDKFGTFSVIMNSPQTKKSQGKSNKKINKELLTKTVTSICLDGQEKIEEKKNLNNLYSTFNIAKNYNPEMTKPTRYLKEAKSKGNLLKSSKNSKNASLKSRVGYSFINCIDKAFANIENTKKELKDIRAEMNEFTHRRMPADKHLRSSTEMNNFQEQQLLNISHISIQSLVCDDNK